MARLGWQFARWRHKRLNVVAKLRRSVFHLADSVKHKRVVACLGTLAQFALAASARVV